VTEEQNGDDGHEEATDFSGNCDVDDYRTWLLCLSELISRQFEWIDLCSDCDNIRPHDKLLPLRFVLFRFVWLQLL